ncbi:ATG5 protein [Purpureocillium lavendulum]|uniref:Autophagy protein 5 n=1 Tax=Purpureocillium lavendulum TaxID=1247861 RepID=A0AB34FNA9_9HYPO|nr:ATG5 protein [Purpureocillium lavendulum]
MYERGDEEHKANMSTTTTTSSSPPSSSSSTIAQALWGARVPLHITHESAPATPFVTAVPRFSYLALLLPRLSAFFGAPCSSFHFEDVQLRNLAAGLLVDLYQPALPWRLTVADGVGWDIGDTFLNCVKECAPPPLNVLNDICAQADFIRNGNANQIMKMSKEHTTQLWNAVIDNDFASFSKVNARLLNAPTALKHVPLRIYIPSAKPSSAVAPAAAAAGGRPDAGPVAETGSFKVVQSLVPAAGPDRKPRLLGQALKETMPRLFPSSRDPVLAGVLLHGAPVPFEAPLGELMREAAYPDGWLCLVVVV